MTTIDEALIPLRRTYDAPILLAHRADAAQVAEVRMSRGTLDALKADPLVRVLNGNLPAFCGMPFVVNESIPAGMIAMVDRDGRVVGAVRVDGREPAKHTRVINAINGGGAGW